MKRSAILLLASLVCLAGAQSPADYVQVRRQNGIVLPVKPEILDALIGSKICEVDGTVMGTYNISYGSKMIQFERSSSDTLVIEADSVPEWMRGREVKARLIVRATREQEAGPLRLHLLNSITEDDFNQIELAIVSHPAKPRATQLASRGEAAPRQLYLPPNQLTPYYAAFVRKRNPRLSRVEADRIATAILAYSAKYGGIDPRLIVALIMVESDFDPNSTSRSGAMGLGQLMPGTAEWMGVRNAYDTMSNIEGCVKLIYTHLKDYYRQTGDWERSYLLMLAAYNAGEGAVRRHGGVPPYRETRAYIVAVLHHYRQLCGYRG